MQLEPKLDQSVEIYQKSPDNNLEIRYDINSAIHNLRHPIYCRVPKSRLGH